MNRPDWLNPTLVVAAIALATGGLGGAVFTWWVKRDPPPRLTYKIDEVVLGNLFFPSLKIDVQNQTHSSMSAHTVAILTRDGYASSANLALVFKNNAKIYDVSATSLSPVHSIKCTTTLAGIGCNLEPVSSGGRYSVTILSDLGQDLQLSTSTQASI